MPTLCRFHSSIKYYLVQRDYIPPIYLLLRNVFSSEIVGCIVSDVLVRLRNIYNYSKITRHWLCSPYRWYHISLNSELIFHSSFSTIFFLNHFHTNPLPFYVLNPRWKRVVSRWKFLKKRWKIDGVSECFESGASGIPTPPLGGSYAAARELERAYRGPLSSNASNRV